MGCSQSKPRDIAQPVPIKAKLALPGTLETECQMKGLFEEQKKFYENMNTFIAQQNQTNAKMLEELKNVQSRSNFFEDHVLDTKRRSSRFDNKEIQGDQKSKNEADQISRINVLNATNSSIGNTLRHRGSIAYSSKREGKKMKMEIISFSPKKMKSPYSKYFGSPSNNIKKKSLNRPHLRPQSPLLTKSAYGGDKTLRKRSPPPLLKLNFKEDENRSFQLDGTIKPIGRPITNARRFMTPSHGIQNSKKIEYSFNQVDLLEKVGSRKSFLINSSQLQQHDQNQSTGMVSIKRSHFSKKKFGFDERTKQHKASRCSFDDATPAIRDLRTSKLCLKQKKTKKNGKFISRTSSSSNTSSFSQDELSIIAAETEKNELAMSVQKSGRDKDFIYR